MEVRGDDDKGGEYRCFWWFGQGICWVGAVLGRLLRLWLCFLSKGMQNWLETRRTYWN